MILGVAVLIGALSYRTGAEVVDSMSDQLLLETVARIGQAVDRHVAGAGPALEAAFPNGLTAAGSIDGEIEALRRRFWIATSLSIDPNNYVYYGNRSGQFLGVWRFSLDDAELRLKLRPIEPRMLSHFTGINGELETSVAETAMYEPRSRPWFKTGETSAVDTWTSTYIDFRTADLVTTRARRVLNANGDFEGVVATDLSLRALNDFVRRLKISEHALAFIIEPNGDLIASSQSPNVSRQTDGRLARLNAAASGDALQIASYAQVRHKLAAGGLTTAAHTLRFAAPDGASVQLAFEHLRDAAGLDWITVVAVPRSDFMQGVTANVVRTAVIGAAAAVAAALLGLGILNSVARDLQRMAEAARAVGEGRLEAPLDVHRHDEIGDLAQTFRAMQERLRVDVLTGLVNRDTMVRSINDRIGQHRRAKDTRAFAVLFLDLNHFKAINDRFGHEVGDRVLIEVGQRLRSITRASDMVARYAGDEFVVLVNDVPDPATADQVRGNIEQRLREPLTTVDLGLIGDAAVSGAVGLALFPAHADSVEGLLAHADADMYSRKSAAKGGRS